ncbi:RuBisCO large subunit C-terminal-like domain-containing protein [Methanogenium marinum]|uniref:RuBisCO large subunit C-terminal-like domain-containing protein n=1 Tax=Methanogenium marinum TaxID=348610 RepID=A0A9Q4KUH1_9EURY|nr:RuBisCO large subunit C-terminal-like domain-containing protein [Methanogenium marinum]MDE4908989.1 RuBisCO large subunit C-terminal-like domain-containing protein [Methanogenium marinum]
MEDVIAHYYFRPDGRTTPQEAAQAIAEEETTGTWTALTTRQDYVRGLDGTVESVEESGRGYLTAIRYPYEIFEPGNVAQYLSVVAGNLFGLGRLEAVRLTDVDFPESLACFNGPNFGIEGVRRLLGTRNRPHVGTIIKPKVGLTPTDTALVAYEAASGGVDFIKDDETLTNQAFCPMADRVEAVMARLDEAKDETGRQVLYAVNISDRADKIVERAEEAIELGANTLMVDVITCGYSALQALAEEPGISVPIHVHRTMHAAMTRNPEHGIAMRPIARLVRMMGGDQLHTGTVSGKMGGNAEELILDNRALTDPWYGFKPVFPVASGGLHPGKIHAELETLGTEIVLQAGGGIHGHPDGTAAGARAMCQAVDAFLEGVSASEYAKDHVELKHALDLWGTS